MTNILAITKKTLRRIARTRFVAVASAFTCLIAVAASASAAQLKEARVTQVVNDVKLLAQKAAPRPAAVSDFVRNGSAIRTGTQSRSELTFTDLTITRLGANTIFSFNQGTREMNLIDGAILFQVPKGSGGATIITAAVTAGITGTTGIGEFHPATSSNAPPFSKWLCLEGTFHLYLANGQSVELGPGKMVTTDGKSFSKVLSFDIGQLVKTSLFFTGFDKPLASLDLIVLEEQKQLAGGFVNATMQNPLDLTRIVDVISQAAVAVAAAVPSEFGPPSVISSPVPYLITSGTVITTDPTITTNGVTDLGKIWRGPAQDGPLSAFIFGSTSAFDTASGFDAELNGQNSNGGAGFKFTSLQLTGNPTVSTTNGEINLGLIAVNGITSGSPGGILTFAGIRGLLIATQDGSINLGSEISFSGIHDINFYARGAGSNLTLGSAISGGTRITLWAQGTIQINGDESATDFKAFSGGDFLAGTGTVTATDINIQSLSNVNIDASKFPDVAGGAINLNAANALTIVLNPGGTFARDLLTGQGATINLQFSSPSTFDLGRAVVSFVAGSGGIQAPNVLFANGGSLLLQATGDINIHGTQNGAGDTILAGGAFSAQSDVSANLLQAGTSIDIGGSVSARDFIEAGTAINVGGQLSALSVTAGTNITAGDVTVLDTTGPTSDGDVDISAGNQISITNGVDINRRFAGASSGLNVLLSAGTDLTAGGSFTVNVDNSVSGNLNTGANIALNAGGNLTINGGGTLSLTVNNSGGGRIGTGGDISVGSGGDLTTSGGVALTIQNTTGTIGTGGNVTVAVDGNFSSAQALSLLVENYDFSANPAGHIGTGGNISVTTVGDLTADSISDFIVNRNGATIGSGANITLHVGGALTTLHNGTDQFGFTSSLSLVISNRYDDTVGSAIGSNATIDLTAGSADIGGNVGGNISTRGGTINGSALFNVSIVHDFIIQGDADLEILSDNVASPIAGTIHGNATLQLSAHTLSANSFFVAINNRNGGVIDSAATLSFTLAGNLITTGGDATFQIANNRQAGQSAGGSIGSHAAVTFNIEGNLATQGNATFQILNQGNSGSSGGSVGGDASVTVNAANIATAANTSTSSAGDFSARIFNQLGSIGGSAIVNVGDSGNFNTQGGLSFNINSNGGNIHGRAALTLGLSGDLTSQTGTANFTIDNSNGGMIGGDASINVSAGSISTTGGSLFADLLNGGGTISTSATVSFGITGDINIRDIASFEIFNNPGTIDADATINVTAANASVGALPAVIHNEGSGHIGGNASVVFNLSGDLTSAGVTNFEIFNNPGTIGADATINVTAGNISIGNLPAVIHNEGGGNIGGNASVVFNLSGDLSSRDQTNFSVFNGVSGNIGGSTVIDVSASGDISSQGGAVFHIYNNDVGSGAGSIGSDAIVNVSARNISSDFLETAISNEGGNIGGTASIDFSVTAVTGDASGNGALFTITNSIGSGANAGSIGSDAILSLNATTVSIGGALSTDISNNGGGSIGGNAAINVNAANINANSSMAQIDNSNGGTIVGDATINMNISSNATVTSDATVQILGSDGAAAAAINFNGGSYSVGSPGSGGMFLGFIDGNGTITFNNASVHADVIKAGVFGANGVLNIGGGVLNADSLLKLYAPGSNGQLNFVSNVTLDGISTKILAANSVTIFNNVVVTIGDDIPASVYTNNANYTGFGGNDTTTGTFGGVGASNPLPLSQAPPFGPTGTSRGGQRSGDRNIARGKTTGPAINLSSTDQLLSLLDAAAPGPGGKITIPASKVTSNSRNSGRLDAAGRLNAVGRLNADRRALDVRTASSSLARRLSQ